MKVTLFDGSFHDVDSSEIAFKIAGSLALKKARWRLIPKAAGADNGGEVVTPEEYMGDVMGDLNRRVAWLAGWKIVRRQIIRLKCPYQRCLVTRPICVLRLRVDNLYHGVSEIAKCQPKLLRASLTGPPAEYVVIKNSVLNCN